MLYEEIQQELNQIGKEWLKDRPLSIDNRRMFAKTKTFQEIRKGKIKFEVIGKMLEDYMFSAEVVNFMFEFIAPFSIYDAIELGVIKQTKEADIQKRNMLIKKIVSNIEFLNYDKEIEILLMQILKDSRLQIKWEERVGSTLVLLTNLIERKKPLLGKCNKEIDFKNESMLLKHYSILFKIFYQGIDRIKDSELNRVVVTMADQPIKHWDIENNKVKDYLKTMSLMPIDSYFGMKKIVSKDKNLSKEDKCTILTKALTSPYASPLEDVYECLIDLEESFSIDISIYLKESFDNSMHILETFLKRAVLKKKGREDLISLRRKYLTPVLEDSENVDFELKILILITTLASDEEFVKFFQTRTNDLMSPYSSLAKEFICDPKKPHTFPQERTFRLIALDKLNSQNEGEYENFNNLVESYFEKVNHSSEVIITWRMANNANLLKEILLKNIKRPWFNREILLSFNIKGIGFDRLLIIIEDVLRETKSRTRLFDLIYKPILKFANMNQLMEYKRLFDPYEVLSLNNIEFKLIESYYKIAKRLEKNSQFKMSILNGLFSGIAKNTKMNKAELVSSLQKAIELSDRDQRFISPTNMLCHEVHTNSGNNVVCKINNPNLKDLTVDEFNELYTKEGVIA